jgi:hypothetical protein
MSTTLIKSNGDLVVPTVEPNVGAERTSTEELVVHKQVGAMWPSRDQRGLVTAEWAVGIIAAAGLAGVLIAVITSGPVQSALLKVILHFISAVADKF